MDGGWWYRVTTVAGVVTITGLIIMGVTSPAVVRLASAAPVTIPLVDAGGSSVPRPGQVATAIAVFLVAFGPLYKPRPRRILDMLGLAARQTVIALFWLAGISYVSGSLGLSRVTILLAVPPLLMALPAWFLVVRRAPSSESTRGVLVGNDPDETAEILASNELPFVGYVAPVGTTFESERTAVTVADGGSPSEVGGLSYLGGLGQLDEVIVDHDIDTAVLAFSRPDRREFFGTLDVCYDHGVTAKVHRDNADAVLTTGYGSDELVDVDLEPWDWQDHLLKRLFDVAFAVVGLVLLAPLMLLVTIAVWVEDGSPIIFRQDRTATFGDIFTVRKFRTMVETPPDVEPTADEANAHITRVGSVLREVHIDELPQLWSILVGHMSVVGPRPAWTAEETVLEGQAKSWRKRWFVRPGLTGLAQINDVSSTAPEAKLRYDIEYIRRQSFWFDLKIVVRQLWLVGLDIWHAVRGWARTVRRKP